MDHLHSLLSRQLQQHALCVGQMPENCRDFIHMVDRAYRQFDADRLMLERSLELGSRELFEANSRMQALLHAFPDLFFRLDHDGKVLSFKSEANDDLFGSPQGLSGKRIQDCPNREVGEKFEEAILRVQAAKEPVSFEYMLSINGAPRFYEARLVPVLASQMLAIIRNITGRKHAETMLEEAYVQTENLLASISLILIEVNVDDVITRWNTTAETTFDLYAEAVVGKPFLHCGIQWDWGTVLQRIAECRGEEHQVLLDDIRYTRPDGRDGFLRFFINPVINKASSSSGYLMLGIENTERKHLETQLSHAQKMESIGQLAAGIAHEINTPMQFINDNTRFLQDSFNDVVGLMENYHALLAASKNGGIKPELVQKVETAAQAADWEYLSEDIPRALQQSLDGIARVTKLVRAMKDFSHPGKDDKAAVDLNKAIESTITVARNEWKYVAEMEIRLDPALPLVPCLLGEFNQVILNIIINAAHAIGDVVKQDPKKGLGKITVSTQQREGAVEIRLSDSGTGIPAEFQKKIFDPFFTTKEVGKGTGQGLAIAHNVIVKKLGGRIGFETEMGKGTTFIITLPIQESKKQAAEVQAS